MLVPYQVDVPMKRHPAANYLVIAAAAGAFWLQAWADEGCRPYVLDGWHLRGLFGHMWLHGGLWHLAGNMVFLWVFGNALCARLGDILYLPVYVGLGLFAAAAHVIFDGDPAIGASGAINGIVGMCFVLFPWNKVSCVWWFYYYIHRFTVRAFWIILFWLAFDIFGAWLDLGRVAYFAHLGGFAAGAALALALNACGVIRMEWYEESLLQSVGLKEKARRLKPFGIPAGRPAAGAATRARPVRARAIPARDVAIHCICGWRARAPSRLGGTRTRCPMCSRLVEIPGALRVPAIRAAAAARRA